MRKVKPDRVAEKLELNIRWLMTRQNITANDMAARMGWSAPTWRARMSNPASFTLAEIVAIAGIFDVPVENMLCIQMHV